MTYYVKTWHCTNAHHIFMCNQPYLCNTVLCFWKISESLSRRNKKQYICIVVFYDINEMSYHFSIHITMYTWFQIVCHIDWLIENVFRNMFPIYYVSQWIVKRINYMRGTVRKFSSTNLLICNIFWMVSFYLILIILYLCRKEW